jgi:hypothetical protein
VSGRVKFPRGGSDRGSVNIRPTVADYSEASFENKRRKNIPNEEAGAVRFSDWRSLSERIIYFEYGT